MRLWLITYKEGNTLQWQEKTSGPIYTGAHTSRPQHFMRKNTVIFLNCSHGNLQCVWGNLYMVIFMIFLKIYCKNLTTKHVCVHCDSYFYSDQLCMLSHALHHIVINPPKTLKHKALNITLMTDLLLLYAIISVIIMRTLKRFIMRLWWSRVSLIVSMCILPRWCHFNVTICVPVYYCH